MLPVIIRSSSSAKARFAAGAIAALLFLASSAAAAQSEPTERVILIGAHVSSEGASTIEGPIDFFRGTDPRPTYLESVGAGYGLGATIGYRIGRAFLLSLLYDVTSHEGERERGRIDQTLHQTAALARLSLRPASAGFNPYVSAGIAVRQMEDGGSSPWPGTQSVWGHAFLVGGGTQLFLRPELAIDGAAEVAYGRFDHAEIQNGARKELGTDRAANTRVRIGVSWYPRVRPLPAPLGSRHPVVEPGQLLRAHSGDSIVSGTVLAISDDTMVVQVRAPLQQVHVRLSCLTQVDAHRGSESLAASMLRSAVQGAVTIGALAIALRPLRGAKGPGEAGPFMLQVVLPGAAAGTALGMTRSRDRWERVTPVGWESPWRRDDGDECHTRG